MKQVELYRKLYKSGISVWGISTMTGIPRNIILEMVRIKPVKKQQTESVFKNEKRWRGQGREMVRFLVRRRDGFTCQSCKRAWNKGERHFDVHHLKGLCGKKSRGYDKVSDMNGLVTLCHKCHFNHPEHSKRRNKTVENSPKQ